MKVKFTIVVIGFVLISSFLLSGCHTTEGFGQDLEKGGQAIQKAVAKETDAAKDTTKK